MEFASDKHLARFLRLGRGLMTTDMYTEQNTDHEPGAMLGNGHGLILSGDNLPTRCLDLEVEQVQESWPGPRLPSTMSCCGVGHCNLEEHSVRPVLARIIQFPFLGRACRDGKSIRG